MEEGEYRALAKLEDGFWWTRSLRALVRTMLARLSGATRHRRLRVLDAGCGTGGMLRFFPRTCKAYGFDLSPTALGHCRSRTDAGLVLADTAYVPFRDGSFDAVVSLDVLYHMWVADHRAAMRELARVCRAGGLILMNLAAHEWMRGSHDVPIMTRQRYRREEVRELVRSSGLLPLKLFYWNGVLVPLLYLRRRLFRGDGRSDVRPLPGALNTILRSIAAFDQVLGSAGLLPTGSSIFAAARKP